MEIKNQIKFNLDNINYLEKSLNKFRNLNMTEFNLLQIEKIKNQIMEKKQEIKNLQENPEEFLKKELPIKPKNIKKNNKKQKIKTINTYKPNFPKKFQPSDRSIQRDCNYFLKNCNSIPDYMRKNLSKMPNNKGYIWRGIYCYGEKKKEKNKPYVMFEKERGGNLKIHEWDKFSYRLFIKGKNQKQVLVFEQERRQI